MNDFKRERIIVRVKDETKGEQALRRYLRPLRKRFTLRRMFPEPEPGKRAKKRAVRRGTGPLPDLSKAWVIGFVDPDVDVSAWASELAKKPEFLDVTIEELPIPL